MMTIRETVKDYFDRYNRHDIDAAWVEEMIEKLDRRVSEEIVMELQENMIKALERLNNE